MTIAPISVGIAIFKGVCVCRVCKNKQQERAKTRKETE